MSKSIVLRPIGVIHTPFKIQAGTPVQPAFDSGTKGEVVVNPEFEMALDDVDGFDYVWLLFWLHKSNPWKPKIVPYRDDTERGLFSTRAPSRPNPIGLSLVRVIARDGCTLRVADLDILDGTPLLDIKPYIQEIDSRTDARNGWFSESRSNRQQADERFQEPPVESSDDPGAPIPKLVLQLDHGCIETTAKRSHRRRVETLLATEQSGEGDEALILLADFLENTDFKALRSKYPELASATGRQVQIRRSKDGSVEWAVTTTP